MKRVLIISPHFPPVNAPDHQRVRMALPHFRKHDWEATVLTVDPRDVSSPQDDSMLKTVPSEIEIQPVRCLSPRWRAIPGLGTLSWRAYFPLRKRGNHLLSKHRFDLVFFSTTQFGVLALGPYWKRKWGIPFCIDLQDPWITSFYSQNNIRPPGGWLKFSIQQMLSRRQAKKVIPEASGLVAVSEPYIQYFTKNRDCREQCSKLTLPFPFSARDWGIAAQQSNVAPPWKNISGGTHWLYPGRRGDDLAPFLRALFKALAQQKKRAPESWHALHLWFIGTQYGNQKPDDRPIEHLARQCKLSGVHEIPKRIPYLDTLQLIQSADGLIVPGSIDPDYNPSKLLPLLSAGKPMLVAAPETSPCAASMHRYAPDHLIPYSLPFSEEKVLQQCNLFLDKHGVALSPPVCLDSSYTEKESKFSTRQLCSFFENCLKHA